MKKGFGSLTTRYSVSQRNNSVLADVIINDPESKMRIRIKEIDEIVKKESRKRRLNAPLTTEEKALLNC